MTSYQVIFPASVRSGLQHRNLNIAERNTQLRTDEIIRYETVRADRSGGTVGSAGSRLCGHQPRHTSV